MVGDAKLSTQFQIVEGSQVVVADESGNDFRDAALIVRDFLEQTEGRTQLYSITPGKQAESIALQLELAIDRDESTVTLSRSDFVCLTSLLENYESHGFGSMRWQEKGEPPVEKERYQDINKRYFAAVEELFPIEQ